MENPTLAFLTDRNDLNDQLFGPQFQRCHEILRQTPRQAELVENLRKLLNVASGGMVFTTIQKFSGRVGVSPGRTFNDAQESATQDASLGGQDAHPTETMPIRGQFHSGETLS